MDLTVVIPTFDPHPGRFAATLSGLEQQCLESKHWELIVIDNASPTPVRPDDISRHFRRNFRLVRENTPGLSHARHCGILEAATPAIVFSDDDNVLAPDYLRRTVELMSTHPDVGIAGGKSLPRYESPPPSWYEEGIAPLGCRDLGDRNLVLSAADYAASNQYPDFAPIGAGMVFRKAAVEAWMKTVASGLITDRKGKSLSSAGDCDMVLHALSSGWSAAYWPSLTLHHLLPASRLTRDYLGAISRAAFRDYIKVLDRHGIRPWSAVPPVSLPLRKLRLLLRSRPWCSPLHYIQWHSALGNLEGRAAIATSPSP